MSKERLYMRLRKRRTREVQTFLLKLMAHRLWWRISPLEKKAWERQIAPLPVRHLFPTRWQCLTGGAGGALKHGDPNAWVVFIAVRHSPIRANSHRSNTTEKKILDEQPYRFTNKTYMLPSSPQSTVHSYLQFTSKYRVLGQTLY